MEQKREIKEYFKESEIEVGDNVLIKDTAMLGVVLMISDEHNDLLYVRFWNHHLRDYDEVVKARAEVKLVDHPIVRKKAVPGDRHATEAYVEMAIELALLTKDREWMQEVIGFRGKKGV